MFEFFENAKATLIKLRQKFDDATAGQPWLRRAAVAAAIMATAAAAMLITKHFQNGTPSAGKAAPPAVTKPADATAQPAAQPVATPAPAATEASMSPAIKPLTALASMTPGLSVEFSYSQAGSIDAPEGLVQVAKTTQDVQTFQMLAKPVGDAAAQIQPGDAVILQTKAVGYFKVDTNSAPAINIKTHCSTTFKIEVYIDDQVVPSLTKVAGGSFGGDHSTTASYPIQPSLQAGLHRLAIVLTTNYKPNLDASAQVSIKNAGDPMPVDMQIFKEST